MCAYMVDQFGNEEQKQTWIPRFGKFDAFASYCLTEPNSGNDSKNMKKKKMEMIMQQMDLNFLFLEIQLVMFIYYSNQQKQTLENSSFRTQLLYCNQNKFISELVSLICLSQSLNQNLNNLIDQDLQKIIYQILQLVRIANLILSPFNKSKQQNSTYFLPQQGYLIRIVKKNKRSESWNHEIFRSKDQSIHNEVSNQSSFNSSSDCNSKFFLIKLTMEDIRNIRKINHFKKETLRLYIQDLSKQNIELRQLYQIQI
ncbi:unnamed protein product [Paramecium sonneborni]|nr:unnamed protein product [Paramecium sonneborni]